MEDSAKFINDSFVDFAGKTHYFTVVATSTNKKGTFAINDEYGDYFPIETEIHLGVSICNPEDPFDGYKGITKATKRADNSPAILYITKKCYGTNGLINKATFLPSIIAKATFIAVIPYVFATSITNGNNP